MSTPTKTTTELCDELGTYVGYTDGIRRTAASLAAHARTYHRLQLGWLNNDYTDTVRAAEERREADLERRIDRLVGQLPEPETADGLRAPWKLTLQSDPQGFTVAITAPDGHVIGLDR